LTLKLHINIHKDSRSSISWNRDICNQ